MFGVIEDEEIGEFLLAQFARHSVHCEEAVGHGGEGEEPFALMPHYDIEPDVIAGQRQNPIFRIPDRGRERAAQHRPYGVAEPFPCTQQHARIRPRHRLWRCQSDAGEDVVAIVEPQVGRDHRPARSAIGLMIELILPGHAHQHMNEADAAIDRDMRAVRPVRTQRIGDAFELGAVHRLTVEAQQSGNAAHENAARKLTLFRRRRRAG